LCNIVEPFIFLVVASELQEWAQISPSSPDGHEDNGAFMKEVLVYIALIAVVWNLMRACAWIVAWRKQSECQAPSHGEEMKFRVDWEVAGEKLRGESKAGTRVITTIRARIETGARTSAGKSRDSAMSPSKKTLEQNR
jgi:hypothetical protein